MYIVSDIILCNCRGLVMGCRWRWWWRWRQISATSRRTSRFERNNTTFVSFLSIPMSSQNIIHFNLTSFGNYGSRTHEGCRDCRDRQAHHSARPPPSEATRSHPPLLQINVALGQDLRYSPVFWLGVIYYRSATGAILLGR